MVFDGEIWVGEICEEDVEYPWLPDACGMDKVRRLSLGFSNSSIRACRIEICSVEENKDLSRRVINHLPSSIWPLDGPFSVYSQSPKATEYREHGPHIGLAPSHF